MRPRCVIALTLLLVAPAHAEGISGCEKKDADPIYCQDGKPRPMCVQDNVIVFAETRLPIPGGRFSFDGQLSLSPCPPKGLEH
jgi:hypothetical protein